MDERDAEPYWSVTRRPLPSLLLVGPLLFAYEFGVIALDRSGVPAARSGVDAWLRRALDRFGLADAWIPPLAILFGLLAWQAIAGTRSRPRFRHLVGMVLESCGYAALLLCLSRIVDLAVSRWDRPPMAALGMQIEPSSVLTIRSLLGFAGAGLYEEAVFRLMMIPVLLMVLRLLFVPRVVAGALAIAASALLFSIAHHFGAPGEAFTWYAFVFRWFAGLYFAWLFIARGFGIVVGAHVVYDVLAGFAS